MAYGLPVYDAFAQSFDNNGEGLIFPSSCTVEEEKNGMYELTCEVPIADNTHYELLQVARMIKAPCPVSEACLYQYFDGLTTMDVYEVNKSSTKMYSTENGGKTLAKYKRDAVLEILEKTNDTYYKARVQSDGSIGYFKVADIAYVRTDTLDPGTPVDVKLSKEQLFRIYGVETDTVTGLVTAHCQHVFYDLNANIAWWGGDVDSWTHAEVAVQNIFEHHFMEEYSPTLTHHLITPTEFDEPLKFDTKNKSFPEILLDGGGIIEQMKAMLYRDNFDIYVLPLIDVDNGVTIRRGKNITGFVMTEDLSDVITYIIAKFKDSHGDDDYYISNEFKSPHINDYPLVLMKEEEFKYQVGTEDTPTIEDVYSAILSDVLKEYEDGIDLPTVGIEVDFVLLGDDDASQELRKLQAVHMFDTVTVIDEVVGVKKKLTVTGYKWDVLAEQYESLTLGDLLDIARA